MNTVKFFFAFVLFFSCTIAAPAQTQQDTNYDNTSLTISKIDIEQTQITVTLEDQKNTVSNTTSTSSTTKTEADTYVFNFNHKQFLKPIIRKRAYC